MSILCDALVTDLDTVQQPRRVCRIRREDDPGEMGETRQAVEAQAGVAGDAPDEGVEGYRGAFSAHVGGLDGRHDSASWKTDRGGEGGGSWGRVFCSLSRMAGQLDDPSGCRPV